MTKAKALSLVQNYTWNEPLANLGQGLTDEWGNILVGLQAQNAEIFQKTYKSASQALSSEDLYWHTGNYCNVVAYENSNGTVKVTNLKFDYLWGEPY